MPLCISKKEEQTLNEYDLARQSSATTSEASLEIAPKKCKMQTDVDSFVLETTSQEAQKLDMLVTRFFWETI